MSTQTLAQAIVATHDFCGKADPACTTCQGTGQYEEESHHNGDLYMATCDCVGRNRPPTPYLSIWDTDLYALAKQALAPPAPAAAEGDALAEAIALLEHARAATPEDNDAINIAFFHIRTASAQMAALRQEVLEQRERALGWKDNYDAALSNVSRLQREIIAVLTSLGADAVRVCEGAGPEDIAASLAVSVAKLRQENERLAAALADQTEHARSLAERVIFGDDAECDEAFGQINNIEAAAYAGEPDDPSAQPKGEAKP